jgi:hypothetical protein
MSLDTFAPLYRLLESSESLLVALTPNLLIIGQDMLTRIPIILISIDCYDSFEFLLSD